MRADKSASKDWGLREFERLTANFNGIDVEFLLDWARVQESVTVFLGCDVKSIMRADGTIPWQAVWLLGLHNKKHMFAHSRAFNVDKSHAEIRDRVNRIKWK